VQVRSHGSSCLLPLGRTCRCQQDPVQPIGGPSPSGLARRLAGRRLRTAQSVVGSPALQQPKEEEGGEERHQQTAPVRQWPISAGLLLRFLLVLRASAAACCCCQFPRGSHSLTHAPPINLLSPLSSTFSPPPPPPPSPTLPLSLSSPRLTIQRDASALDSLSLSRSLSLSFSPSPSLPHTRPTRSFNHTPPSPAPDHGPRRPCVHPDRILTDREFSNCHPQLPILPRASHQTSDHLLHPTPDSIRRRLAVLPLFSLSWPRLLHLHGVDDSALLPPHSRRHVVLGQEGLRRLPPSQGQVRRHQPVSQLLLRPALMYLPRHPPEERPQGLAGQGHQRVARDPATDHPLLQGRQPPQWPRQRAL
jgi:hypothetical protein